MSLLSRIMSVFKPDESYRDPSADTEDKMLGAAIADSVSFSFFRQMSESLRNMNRAEFLEQVLDMSNDFALADKTLQKLCADATSNPVRIDAPTRRKKIIHDFLKTVNYEEHRKSWIYLLLRDGDEFLQKKYSSSSKPGRVAFISSIMRLPTETMLRNTNERDEFIDFNKAFFQVPDIKGSFTSYKSIAIPFPLAKIHHARNDWEESIFFRYGRSIWASAIRPFNMAVMALEDSAIQRHQNTQNIMWHLINKHSDTRATESIIKEYKRRFEEAFNEETTHMFIDGKHGLEQHGGTKSIIGTVEDVRLMLSILAIALDYPIDLLSVGVTGDSGGEELFRKEVVLKRTIENIIKRENRFILRPLIDTELFLAGDSGKYEITTFPTSFEDANKKSKRGLLEIQAGVKSWKSYHEENNPEISFEEERKRVEEDISWKKKVGVSSSQFTRASSASGAQGSSIEPDNQQERKTPGERGVDDREVDK